MYRSPNSVLNECVCHSNNKTNCMRITHIEYQCGSGSYLPVSHTCFFQLNLPATHRSWARFPGVLKICDLPTTRYQVLFLYMYMYTSFKTVSSLTTHCFSFSLPPKIYQTEGWHWVEFSVGLPWLHRLAEVAPLVASSPPLSSPGFPPPTL